MIGLITGIGIVLILAILLVLFRIQTLVELVKGNTHKKVTKSNKINAYLLLFFIIISLLLFWWFSVKEYDHYTLPIGSEHGVWINDMFWVTMAVTLSVFLLTQILLFYFSFRYRYRENYKASFFPHNDTLEKVWTIVPAVVMAILVFSGLKVWNKITSKPPADAEVVEIMGYQFAWKTRYPGNDKQLGKYDFRLIDATNIMGVDFRDKAAFDDIEPRELHLPKGKPVLFKIRARDVIHSVYAPHFRLKMDAVPGMPTSFWFTPTKSTADMRNETGNPNFNYEIACAEVCGRGHFSMRLMVIVDEPDQYEKWKSEQKSWLSSNPDYLAKVPDELKELALIKSGLDKPVN
jgi:cytochrome c oxidase subunit 2